MAEGLIRLLISDATFEDKFLMWSSPPFRLDQKGAVRYMPNDSIREIAIYNGNIEYDVRFETNDMGLIDHVNYLESGEANNTTSRIAFVGDSFVAGAGGNNPWVPQLRDRIRQSGDGIQIYNLGVEGAGIEHFRRLLASISSEIPLDKIIIFAISNDFTRPFWRPLITIDEVRFCPLEEAESVCAKRVPIATIIDANAGEDEILARVAELRTARQTAAEQTASEELPYLLRNSRLFMLIYNFYNHNPLLAAGEKKQHVSDALLYFVQKENLTALKNIIDMFPDTPVHLVHLPERHEVRAGHYDLELEENTRKLGIEYFHALSHCDWSENMYHPNDPHPNDYGYTSISTCVENYLFPARH